MSCGVGRRRGSDPPLLWLRCRPATTALIQPLAWEPPYAAGVAVKGLKQKRKKKANVRLDMSEQTQTRREQSTALRVPHDTWKGMTSLEAQSEVRMCGTSQNADPLITETYSKQRKYSIIPGSTK